MITIEDIKKDLGGTTLVAYYEFTVEGIEVCQKMIVEIEEKPE